MTTITNVNEINRILRATIIAQSGMASDNVRNALSLHGETLEKLVANTSTVYQSYEVTDCFALFELSFRESNNNLSFTDVKDLTNPVTNQSSFSFKLTIYGNGGLTAANTLVSRLRTEKVRQDLMLQGVFLERVSNPVSINEYINESMWLRTDVDIDLCCEMSINQISTDYEVASLTSVIIQ